MDLRAVCHGWRSRSILIEYSMCSPRYKPSSDQFDLEIAQLILAESDSLDSFLYGMEFAQIDGG